MRKKDLIPQKRVAEELCVSLSTLWRARMSGIEGFPEPVIRLNMVHWRAKDMQKLEDALLKFKGRVVFERKRNAERKFATLQKSKLKPGAGRKRSGQRSRAGQCDLFE